MFLKPVFHSIKSRQSQTIAKETLLITPRGIAEISIKGIQIRRFFVVQPMISVRQLEAKPPRQETIIMCLYSNFL